MRDTPTRPGVLAGSATRLSADGSWWWDGAQWLPATTDDGLWQWDGAAWRPTVQIDGVDAAALSNTLALLAEDRYEQAGAVVSEELPANNPLNEGSGRITGIPPQPVGQFATIDIVMSIDEDGLLHLRATERSTGNDLVIKVAVGLSAEKLGHAIDAVSKISVSS